MLSFQVLPVILVWLQRLCIWVCCLLLFILVLVDYASKTSHGNTWMLKKICCHEPRSHLEVDSEINLRKNVREIHVNSKAVIGIHDGYNKLGKIPLGISRVSWLYGSGSCQERHALQLLGTKHMYTVYLIDLEYQECIAGIINMAIFEVSNLKLKCTYGNVEACPLW